MGAEASNCGPDSARKSISNGCCSRGPHLKSIARKYLRRLGQLDLASMMNKLAFSYQRLNRIVHRWTSGTGQPGELGDC